MHPLIRQVLEQRTRPGFAAWRDELSGAIGLLAELADCPQDPSWHAEGDVAIHTEMVLEETYELLETIDEALSPELELTLILGALLHDIAKPLCTREAMVEGRPRIIAPRHADRGRSLLAYQLPALGLPAEVAQGVLALVGHHHDPKFLVLRDRPRGQWYRLARLAPMQLLYWLELADIRGRRCGDRQEQLDLVELYWLLAHEEYGLGGDQRPPLAHWRPWFEDQLQDQDPRLTRLAWAQAVRDFEAGAIFTPEEGLARSYQWRERPIPELVVTCGPSGAGKSSWARERYPDHAVVAMDDIRGELTGAPEDQSMNGQVFQEAKERLKAHLRQGQDVIWDATNIRRRSRQLICGIGQDYGAHVTLAVMCTPAEDVFARNAGRERRVPPKIVAKQLQGIELPYADEAHQLLIIDGKGQIAHDSQQP